MSKILLQWTMMWVTITAFAGVTFPLIVTGLARVLFASPYDPSPIDDSLGAAPMTRVASEPRDADAANGNDRSGASLGGNTTITVRDSTAQTRGILHGLRGAHAGGIVYPLGMQSLDAVLGDADVVNYERNRWGNCGSAGHRCDVQ